MFTGIVEEVGEVLALEAGRLQVASRTVAQGLTQGASVSVSGACLTVVAVSDGAVAFDVSQETLARTGIATWAPGHLVNLERPVTLATRLGGHLVQGHVDGRGRVASMEPDGGGGLRVGIDVPPQLMRYVVEKGSISIDGVSLTVSGLDGDRIEVSLVPYTIAATTLGALATDDVVNLEVDVVAKHVERLLGMGGI